MFVDEDFDVFPDQWAYLAGVQRIAPSTVERVAADTQRNGQVLGVRTSGLEEEDTSAPWLIPPSRRSALVAPIVKEPVPTRVEATLAQRLFITNTGLPSSLINALRRIAAFQNPDFYQKQRLRLSTTRTRRIIHRAENFRDMSRCRAGASATRPCCSKPWARRWRLMTNERMDMPSSTDATARRQSFRSTRSVPF